MKTYLTLTALIVLLISCSKDLVNPELVREFKIQSTLNPGSYDIKVALPENYDPHNKSYSTVYVLDGDQDFAFVAGQCKELSEKYSTENVLVVSIGHGHDRTLDYTPTEAQEGGGGAPLFMQFIEYELIPRIQADFAADTTRSSRTILGHSFGGLFAAYAFTNHNRVFGNYLMLSPSLWYDDEILLQYEQVNRSANSANAQLIFLGIGEMENSGRMQAPFEAFYQRMSNYYPRTTLSKNSVPRLGHVGSKNPNIEKALAFYFQNH
jgi:predicted alpha/beta superfamily hydrolase